MANRLKTGRVEVRKRSIPSGYITQDLTSSSIVEIDLMILLQSREARPDFSNVKSLNICDCHRGCEESIKP